MRRISARADAVRVMAWSSSEEEGVALGVLALALTPCFASGVWLNSCLVLGGSMGPLG